MKALGWDDKPEEYFHALKQHLLRHNIDMEIVEDEDEFVTKFSENDWDFIVTDLIHENAPTPGDDDRVGVRLADGVAKSVKGKSMPIYVVTQHYDRLNLGDVALPPTAILKSKSTHAGWMAGEIYEDLIRQGVYVDRRKVFLIYGHDKNAMGAKGRVEYFLNQLGISVEVIAGGNLEVEIAHGLISKMNTCAAIVAICTPDDELKNGSFHPRQNVLLEIGMAMGLSRGVNRLIILQKWGPREEDKAKLPSDLHGLIPIRFEGPVDDVFSKLEFRLKESKVALMSPAKKN